MKGYSKVSDTGTRRHQFLLKGDDGYKGFTRAGNDEELSQR